MTKKTFEKEMQKKADKIQAVRSEIYHTSSRQSLVILVLAVTVLLGMALSLVNGAVALKIVGGSIMLLGGLIIIFLYAKLRKNGPLSFTQYDFEVEKGEWATLQAISKNKLAFSYRGQTIRWEKGAACAGSLFYDQPKWNWFLSCSFDEMQERDKQMTQLSFKSGGTKNFIQLKDGFPYYAETSGKRIHYLELNSIKKEQFVPRDFYTAIKKAGVTPPQYIKSL